MQDSVLRCAPRDELRNLFYVCIETETTSLHLHLHLRSRFGFENNLNCQRRNLEAEATAMPVIKFFNGFQSSVVSAFTFTIFCLSFIEFLGFSAQKQTNFMRASGSIHKMFDGMQN